MWRRSYLRRFHLAQVVQARGNVVDDRTAHGVVFGAACLLRDCEAVGECVEGLLKLALMEERLGLSEKIPFQLLELVPIDVLANLQRSTRKASQEKKGAISSAKVHAGNAAKPTCAWYLVTSAYRWDETSATPASLGSRRTALLENLASSSRCIWVLASSTAAVRQRRSEGRTLLFRLPYYDEVRPCTPMGF
jgi:hypothetical protein